MGLSLGVNSWGGDSVRRRVMRRRHVREKGEEESRLPRKLPLERLELRVVRRLARRAHVSIRDHAAQREAEL